MRRYMMTAHSHFVGYDEGGAPVQLKYNEDTQNRLVVLPETYETVLTDAPLKGFCMLKSGENTVSFSKDEVFLCAEPLRPDLVHNRAKIGPWERFIIVPEDKLSSFSDFYLSPEHEIARFSRTVSWYIDVQKPVKLYIGCGRVPRPGFLNLDITVYAPEFSVYHSDEYFIFPFADRPWGLPDNSVDYIFQEDFIEHVSQLQQIQVLAEALRVLKPGQYHRVNTPNLLRAMKLHSDFSKGFVGVYTGELQWGHISLFTPGSLKEIAEMVGYREVVFTTKNHGVSAFAEQDFRPQADRDEIFGNIYADLVK
jgi:SAM-dependent methyltransferase